MLRAAQIVSLIILIVAKIFDLLFGWMYSWIPRKTITRHQWYD